MAKRKRDTLPATIYVVQQRDENDDASWLDAEEDPARHTQAGERVRVGVYKLAGYADVVNETSVKAVSKGG